MKILVVEDDLALSAGLCFELTAAVTSLLPLTTAERQGSFWKAAVLIWQFWM